MKKTFTFLVVSNKDSKTYRFVVPAVWLKGAFAVFVVLTFVLFASLIDYYGLLEKSTENRKLRTENQNLVRQFQVVEGKVDTLESNLERVQNFMTKLRLITNLDSDDRALQLAIGPMPKSGQNVQPNTDYKEGEGRLPAVRIKEMGDTVDEEALFLQGPVPNQNEGQLAVHRSREFGSLAVRIDQAISETHRKEEDLLDLWEMISERQSLLAALPSIKPTRGWITSRFGYRISPFTRRPVMHNGLDIAARVGTPIYAPADGKVIFAGYDRGYGNLVSIDHGYNIVTRFGHSSRLYVKVGDYVQRRDLIAAVGSTGQSTGPHLHYEVRINNIPVDPMNYILDIDR